jgi:glycosyltransferase involved in cell wall biosynthesis
LKIGLVTGEFPPMQGGVGAFTEQLALALAGLGHSIHIITDRRARLPVAERRLSQLFEPIDLGYALLHARAGRWRWPTMGVIADIAVRYGLDVVNIQYQAAAYNMNSAAINLLPWRLRGVTTTAVTFHDLRVPYLFPKAGRVREAAVRWLAQQTDGVIVTNAADGVVVRRWTAKPMCQIPIGSNIDVYTPNHIELAEVREQLGLGAADFLLGYFGFLNESKGAGTLLEALAKLDERFHLVFFGGQTGDSDRANNEQYLAQLREQIAMLGLDERVHWTGFLSPVRVSAHLHAADLMVMPYRDGASLRRGTLMAVLAHGRPLVTTVPQPAAAELRHGENIWLVEAEDAEKLAAAVQRLASDETKRHALGAGAEQLAGLFTWERIAAETAAFFETIMLNSNYSLVEPLDHM